MRRVLLCSLLVWATVFLAVLAKEEITGKKVPLIRQLASKQLVPEKLKPTDQKSSTPVDQKPRTLIDACFGAEPLLRFVDRSNAQRCVTGRQTQLFGARPQCKLTVGPCDATAAEVFFGYSGESYMMIAGLEPDRMLQPANSDEFSKLIADLQKQQQPQVAFLQMGFKPKDNVCGDTHSFAIVHWPDAAPGAPTQNHHNVCLFQSYVYTKSNIGFSLRQWVHGFDVKHEQQTLGRKEYHQTNAEVLEKSRQQWAGKQPLSAFADTFAKLYSTDTSQAAFTSLFGCDPGKAVTMSVSGIVVAPATLKGFPEMEKTMKDGQCPHSDGNKQQHK